MTPTEYWVRWAVAGAVFLFALYWVIRWSIRAELGWRFPRM